MLLFCKDVPDEDNAQMIQASFNNEIYLVIVVPQ